MSPHISFDPDTTDKLKAFVTSRGKNASHWIRSALERLFSTEHPDREKQLALTIVLDRYFHIPKNIPYYSFYSFLFMLTSNYPNESANKFWGEVFLSEKSWTHAELKAQLDDEIKRILAIKSNGKAK